MRSTSAWLVPTLISGIVAASCATELRSTGSPPDGSGDGGHGGAGSASSSSSSASSSSSGAPGPCVKAEDCAALTTACADGACINGACSTLPKNDGASCDDGKNCTEGDTCSNGVCTGSLKFCPSMDTCHVGSCDVATDTCVQVPGNEGAPCVDQDPCTQAGACKSGVCQGGPQVDCSFLDSACAVGVCDPQIGCKTAPKNDGASCNDGFFCTVNDVCTGGVCSGAPNNCADPGNTCQVGACDEASNTCVAAVAPDGTACVDASACKTGTTCLAGACQGGVPANEGAACDDANACTAGTVCTNGACSGGSSIGACTGGDGCCPAGCTPAMDSDCDCFTDWLVGTPCNGVDFGNGCVPEDTGYHFVGIFDNFACFWHHKNQAWNTSPASNFYALAQHFNVMPGTGHCHWCDDKFSQPTPLAYDTCQFYFDQGNVGAWGWCAESDPNSVGFVCIPSEGHLACP